MGCSSQVYEPLEIRLDRIAGIDQAMVAMRLAKPQGKNTTAVDDLALAAKLIKAGDDHAKITRGCMVWYTLRCQVGWLLEYEQYEVGVTRMCSSSSMHDELKNLSGYDLANRKQLDLSQKVYTIADVISYQTLRRIYKARHGHRHPDWQIFRGFIESLPYFDSLIYPEGSK